ncbi:hypothetical protein [Botrimarina sp.]|uniref:hypothetical protein n=1 Tax=Botrimarina sp. TaxID=2795802 RepID=UPI0032EF01E2
MRSAFLVLSATLAASVFAQSDEFTERAEPPRPTAEFMQPGEWWNLYFVEGGGPLDRGRVTYHACGVLAFAKDRPNWVLVRWPAKEEDHVSLVRAVIGAREGSGVSLKEAIGAWEKGISRWRTMWVNLDHVSHASRVEPRRRSANEDPP